MSNAHVMLRIKRNNWIAFAEKEDREQLLTLRRSDPRLKGGKIIEVLQMHPSTIVPGHVYSESR